MNPFRQGIKSVMSAVLPPERWLVHGPKTSTGIALTFDDGPHLEHTPRLLDELRKFSIRATFFVVGQSVARSPELTRRIVAEGHILGGHTYTHSEPAETSAAKLMDEVRRSHALIEDLTGQQLTLFRPPKGKLSLSKTLRLWTRRQTIVLWNRDPRDYLAVAPQGIQPWVQQYQPVAGDIVLLHDTHPHCIQSIEPLVRRVAACGLRDFVTIDEWISKKQRAPETPGNEPVLNAVSTGHVRTVKRGFCK